MAQRYIVVNHHKPEECEALELGVRQVPEHLVGQPFYCPCPYGEHAFYMVLEGESSEDVITRLPRPLQPGTRAVPIETYFLGH